MSGAGLRLLSFGLVSTWLVALAGPRGGVGSVGAQAPAGSPAAISTAPTVSASTAVSTAASTTAYVGSEACQACHPRAYAAWKVSIHSRMTQSIATASVDGDFTSGSPVTQHGRTYWMTGADGRHSVSIASRSTGEETFEVHYTLGTKRFQGYLSRLRDGRIYVLPTFWDIAGQRWLDWSDLAPVPESEHDLRQIWNVNCFNCHATNIERNFDVAARSFATTATEMGVGCEACHGPGSAHVALTTAWEAAPATLPPLDLRDGNRGLTDDLRVFSARTADRRQVYDSCAYCHGNKKNVMLGFTPGARLEDFAQLTLISDPVPASDQQGEFWPDGRPSRFNRPQALTLSGCFQSGQLTCTNCHVAHGSTNDHSLTVPLEQSDRLCTQCHQPLAEAAALSRHSHHPAESPGSRCVQCHMSDVNWRLLMRRRDHTFAPPVPEITARYGTPNACTTCHEARSPEWAAATMDTWYGNAARRRAVVDVADTVYRAGSGDRTALDPLGALAIDRSRGSLLRASAAGFIGRLLAPGGAVSSDVLRALVSASADPEPMVRISAVRSLGGVGSVRAASGPAPGDPASEAGMSATASSTVSPASDALLTRLRDDARVVRIAAAEAILYAGVAPRTEAEVAALARAQVEYAESLAAFPDVASNHAALGWLRASQGRVGEATRALQRARALDPADAQPHVYLGVLAARQGRYDAAIAAWRTARGLNPTYPNIDRLIAEATARLSGASPR